MTRQKHAWEAMPLHYPPCGHATPTCGGRRGHWEKTPASRGSCAPRGVRAGTRRSTFSPCLPGPGPAAHARLSEYCGLDSRPPRGTPPTGRSPGAGAAERPQRRKPDQRAGVLTAKDGQSRPPFPEGSVILVIATERIYTRARLGWPSMTWLFASSSNTAVLCSGQLVNIHPLLVVSS